MLDKLHINDPADLSSKALNIAAGLVILMPAIVLIGWQFSLDGLERLTPSAVAMNPLDALCFITLGIVLILLHGAISNKRRRLALCLALAVVVIGILITLRYALHIPFSPDQWLYAGELHVAGGPTNVMAPNTAICFLLGGLSLLLIMSTSKIGLYIAQCAAMMVSFVAMFAILGYIYNIHALTTIGAFIPMASNTALCFLLLSIGILFLKPREGLMFLANSDQGAGYLIRRLLPVVVVVPAFLGWLTMIAERANLYNDEVGAALSVAANIFFGFILIWIGGFALYRKELEIDHMKDEFLNLTTHQLQTPSTGVRMALLLLRDRSAGKLNKPQAELVDDAIGGIEREIDIVRGLLDVARADSGRMILKKEPIDLRELIESIVDEQRPTITSRKQQITVEADHVVANVDSARLRMAIENLVSNASKYTPDGGKLRIEVHATGKQCTITVIDSGVGIAKEDIPKIFVKFTRLDNPLSATRGGTGLGVYLVKRIAELHGGEITVTSTLGKGSQFTVKLPVG